jgi:hypothetical protein
MYIQNVDRKQLIDILAGKAISNGAVASAANEFPVYPPLLDEMYLIWEENPKKLKELPAIIVVNDEMVRDFFAWTSTFIAMLRPFSAYIRVLPFKLLSDFKNIPPKPSLKGIEEICAAVIISESLSISPERTTGHLLNPLVCSSTFSHCMARALALGGSFDNLEYLSERLFDARRLTSQPQRKLDLGSVMAVWHVIANLNTTSNSKSIYNNYKYKLSKNDTYTDSSWKQSLLSTLPSNNKNANTLIYYLDYILEACQQYEISSDISDSLFDKLTNYDNAFVSMKQDMLESLERRVVCFNKILSSDFFNQPEIPLVKSFICGYVASRVSPGSLLHSDLIWPHINKYPAALLWYGLFAGLTPKNDVLTSFDGLGRRLIRDLLDSSNLFDQPRSDISLEELEVFLLENSRISNFRRGSTNHVAVELAPCITTALRWPDTDRKNQQTTIQDSVKSDTPSDLFSELGIYIKKIEDLYRRLAKSEQVPTQKDVVKKSCAKKISKTSKWNKSDKDEQGRLII